MSSYSPSVTARPQLASHHHNNRQAQSSGREELYEDFPNRDGYQENFLGVDLPLPELDPSIRNQAAPLLKNPGEYELKYTHFSVVQNKDRRTPIFTAVNVDGSQYQEIERKGKWALDARISRDYQMGNEAYSNNPIDKGHMTRRKDPMWGSQARQASGDTFVYTNCSLQHSELNQHHWLDLENHVLDRAVAGHQKVSVFTGPVLRDDDPSFDNHGKMDTPTKIPLSFWKLVVWNENGHAKGEAYVMSQKDMLHLPQAGQTEEHLTPDELKTYQVPITTLEDMTKLDFGPIESSFTTIKGFTDPKQA